MSSDVNFHFDEINSNDEHELIKIDGVILEDEQHFVLAGSGDSADCEYVDQEYLILNDFDEDASAEHFEEHLLSDAELIDMNCETTVSTLQTKILTSAEGTNTNTSDDKDYEYKSIAGDQMMPSIASTPVALTTTSELKMASTAPLSPAAQVINKQLVKIEKAELNQSAGNRSQVSQIKPNCSAVSSQTKMTCRDHHKGPQRYLLFDDLIATIVDYDDDITPIVEFSLSNMEADRRLPIECGICPDIMSKSKLNEHLATHLVPGTNRYACVYCDETYRDSKYLAGHARRHMGIRPYVCTVCKLYFSTKQDLRVHNQRRHLEKEHTCEICGKTFAQNTQLKRHRESTHEKMRRFKCEFCPKGYYKNFSLQEHIRNVHMGQRRMLVCPFCGMECRDAHKMARHRKQMHLNQSTYTCVICQEEFTDIKYFDAHKRSIQCRNNTQRKQAEEGEQKQQKLLKANANEHELRDYDEDDYDEDGDGREDLIEEGCIDDQADLYDNAFVQHIIEEDGTVTTEDSGDVDLIFEVTLEPSDYC